MLEWYFTSLRWFPFSKLFSEKSSYKLSKMFSNDRTIAEDTTPGISIRQWFCTKSKQRSSNQSNKSVISCLNASGSLEIQVCVPVNFLQNCITSIIGDQLRGACSKKIIPQRLTVAGEAADKSLTSKIILVPGESLMISPLVKQSFLLSSSTVFMFSIHKESTGPSNTIHWYFLEFAVSNFLKILGSTPSDHSWETGWD